MMVHYLLIAQIILVIFIMMEDFHFSAVFNVVAIALTSSMLSSMTSRGQAYHGLRFLGAMLGSMPNQPWQQQHQHVLSSSVAVQVLKLLFIQDALENTTQIGELGGGRNGAQSILMQLQAGNINHYSIPQKGG